MNCLPLPSEEEVKAVNAIMRNRIRLRGQGSLSYDDCRKCFKLLCVYINAGGKFDDDFPNSARDSAALHERLDKIKRYIRKNAWRVTYSFDADGYLSKVSAMTSDWYDHYEQMVSSISSPAAILWKRR